MHPMLNIAVRAARRAGTIIVQSQRRLDEVKFERKGHHDYVSQVDRDAESAIIDTLSTAFPDHQILAEESGSSGQSDHVWIIDPLDGTLNFLHGYPQFAVSIALTVKGRLDQAVVYDPMRDELFTASRGAGAQLNGRRIRVTKCLQLDNALLATGFAVRRKSEMRACLDSLGHMLGHCADVRRAGAAALDLAYVACARLDGFWEFGLKPWDVAAGSLLIQESGGLVGDTEGGEAHVERGDIVAANPKLFRQILTVLAHQRSAPAATT
ncbi:MAG: inositol monophosphatase family protein [Gammaproteobacteria bacterium]|nr:inositol monophosphatase family protein [Gammaproteobacteria bacterium]